MVTFCSFGLQNELYQSICNCSYLKFWIREKDFCSDCTSLWSACLLCYERLVWVRLTCLWYCVHCQFIKGH